MEARKIRAAVLRKRGSLRIETVEMEGPRDDEVLVRIVAAGICHTDISFVDGWGGAQFPVVLGHEGAGIVEEVGDQVRSVEPGDHVVLSYQSCGSCFPCRDGRPTECDNFWEANFGFKRLDGSNALGRSGVGGHFFGQSSFATYALATRRNLVVVPKDLPLEVLAPLGCGMQTGAGTIINSLKVPEGASIAVFGTGSVGLAAIMAARVAGANPIVAVDVIPARLDLALTLGATHAIDNRNNGMATRIAVITRGGVDYVLETTGDPVMSRVAGDILNPGGTVALLTGVSATDSLPEGRRVISIIQGSAVPQRFIPELIALYRSGRFPFDQLIRFYDFSEINDAMADARRGDTIKPVLRIGRAW